VLEQVRDKKTGELVCAAAVELERNGKNQQNGGAVMMEPTNT
jgi:hypothetical protein